MRVLLDHCVPQPLRRDLIGHDVSTCAQLGWSALKNGSLLRAAAEARFDVMITVDQSLKHQQHLPDLPVAVMVLCAVSNDVAELRRLLPLVMAALDTLTPKQLVEIRLPPGTP